MEKNCDEQSEKNSDEQSEKNSDEQSEKNCDKESEKDCVEELEKNCDEEVHNLLDSNGEWDLDLLRDIFSDQDIHRIINTPVSPLHPDSWYWKDDLKGAYTVRHGNRWWHHDHFSFQQLSFNVSRDGHLDEIVQYLDTNSLHNHSDAT
nr:uncharacterized protein LOC109164092 [Ipomoea batatas]